MKENWKNIAIRIDEFRINKGWSKGKFAEVMDIDAGSVAKYLRGELNPENLYLQLQYVGADMDYIKTGTLSTTTQEPLVPLQTIPVFAHLRAGNETLVYDSSPVDYIAIPKTKDKSLLGVIVKGESMSPVIENGDIVVISLAQEPSSGDICAVTFENGESCLRYLHLHDHSITLTSANPRYIPKTYRRNEIKFIYKIVSLHRKINQ